MSLRTTKEQAHTPGPWSVTRSKMATDGAFDYAISAIGASVIAEAFGRDVMGGWPPAEANARLIAAAPDLLAALEAMVLNDRHTYRDCHKKAVRAIARATGAAK